MSGNLPYQFARLNMAERLIVINVAVFIVTSLLTFLLGLGDGFLAWFQLPQDFFDFMLQPWSLITYSFLHSGFFHLFWNMLLLYFTGRIFLNLFNAQRLLNVYFMGVIAGGLLFMLAYNVFPVFSGIRTALIGASAGVMAVLLFICTYIPNHSVRIIFFNAKLWQIGVFMVLMDLLQLPYSGNAGGHFAHLGGALLGYVYARQLGKGHDIGSGFTKIFTGLENIFTGKKKAPLRTVHRKVTPEKTVVDYDRAAHQKKIDAILDKIGKSGYESLSKAEKDFLFKAGKED